jgi:hypothetical protein
VRPLPAAVAAGVALALAFAAPVAAHEPPAHESTPADWTPHEAPSAEPAPDLALALRAAREHWGGVDPPCGSPTVRIVAGIPGGGGAAWKDRCLIHIDERDVGFDTLCNLLTHEIGHLHGHDHDEYGVPLEADQVGGVMDYETIWARGSVPACDSERRRRVLLEERWVDLNDRGWLRRDRCRRVRAARAGRRAAAARTVEVCARARGTSQRARLLRRKLTWMM